MSRTALSCGLLSQISLQCLQIICSLCYPVSVYIQVPHFTKYGLVDEGDGDEIVPTDMEKRSLRKVEDKQRSVQVW